MLLLSEWMPSRLNSLREKLKTSCVMQHLLLRQQTKQLILWTRMMWLT